MKRIALILACGSLTLAFTGCDSGGSDDAGGIMLFDSGPRVDAGPRDAGGSTDAGPPRECAMNLPGPFPTALTPRCSAATRDCMNACTSGACINACITADTTPAAMVEGLTVTCGSCLSYQQAYCVEQNGGADLLHALNCCIEDRACTTQACAQSMCSTQFSAVYSTSNPAAATCLSAAPTMGDYAICFATASADAGVGDAGMADAGVDAGP